MKILDTIGSTTWLSNFHTFCCPIYMQDACLQGVVGGGPPKWDPQTRLRIYLGQSPSNAGGVALVVNPKYGLVSPQFNLFEIVPHLWAENVTENWAQLVASYKENSIEGFYDVTKTWFEGKVDPYDDPQASCNHQASPLTDSQPNGGLTRSVGQSYPISLDNDLVSGFEPSGYPQQICGYETKQEVPRTGGMISSDVLPANGQL